MKPPWKLAALAALCLGLVVGWIDLGATDVQGPLLLLMLASFIVALGSRAPVWIIALAATLGLPLVAIGAWVATGTGDPQWAMLIALVPALLAAFAGRAIGTLIRSTAGSLATAEIIEKGNANADIPHGAWHERPAEPAYLVGGALLGCALVGAVPVYATSVARGQPITWWVTTWWQVVSFVAWALAAPFLLRAWRRMRREDGVGVAPAELLVHGTIIACIAATHALVLPLLTRALMVPLGPSGLRGAVTWAFAALLPLDTLTYCLIIGLGHASNASRRARAAATREAAVRGELATTRLASLRAQLRPHFLFNALNAATVLTRRGDAESAAGVLARLADLLRYVLRGAEDDVAGERRSPASDDLVRLGDEITFAESYLAIERERFPDRLRTSTDAGADARAALVPHLLLQPLVENAIQHGIGARIGAGNVTIRALRDGDTLHVMVDDDGPGLRVVTPAPVGNGIGIANTRARLSTIYGGRADLSLDARPGGGTSAHIVLPYRT